MEVDEEYLKTINADTRANMQKPCLAFMLEYRCMPTRFFLIRRVVGKGRKQELKRLMTVSTRLGTDPAKLARAQGVKGKIHAQELTAAEYAADVAGTFPASWNRA